MSEIPKDPQFVGSSEAPKKEAFVLTAEQQQVTDTMKKSGEVLEHTMLDARERAAGQLKQLHGKELVDAGLKQMSHGVWETVKSQLKWGIGGGLIGAVAGGAFGYASNKIFEKTPEATAELLNKVGDGFDELRRIGVDGELLDRTQSGDFGPMLTVGGSVLGGFGGGSFGGGIGWETAGLKYNKKIAPKANLPSTKWYDWAISNAGVFGVNRLLRGKDIGRAGGIAKLVFHEVFNPITVGGLRNVATGLWQMGKGQ